MVCDMIEGERRKIGDEVTPEMEERQHAMRG